MKWTFPNLRLFLSLAVITGGIYPLVVTLVSLIFFPHQAHGSLIRNERGEIIASELVAQPFISAKYFWPRPSARRILLHALRSQQPLLDFREAGQDGGGAQGGSAESPQSAGENACPCGHAFCFRQRFGAFYLSGSGGISIEPCCLHARSASGKNPETGV